MKGCYLENKISEPDGAIQTHLCDEDPCPLQIEEDMARLKNGFVTTYIDLLEPREILDVDILKAPDGWYQAVSENKLQQGWTIQRNDHQDGWMLYPPKQEPSDWEEQYTAGEPQMPAMWMIIVMAVGAVAIFYGIMIGVAYLLT